jgi:YggT family protein
MNIAITIINTLVTILTYFIVIYSLLTFFMDPFHPVRSAMARVAEPMLLPIRKLIPPLGGFDISPIILIIFFQVVGAILVRILRSVG